MKYNIDLSNRNVIIFTNVEDFLKTKNKLVKMFPHHFFTLTADDLSSRIVSFSNEVRERKHFILEPEKMAHPLTLNKFIKERITLVYKKVSKGSMYYTRYMYLGDIVLVQGADGTFQVAKDRFNSNYLKQIDSITLTTEVVENWKIH